MKTEPKHTKGPWNVTGYLDGYYKILGAQIELDPEDEECTLTLEERVEIDEANCRLISQAPDLLQTLKDLHGRISGLKHFGPMSTNTIEEILVIAEQAVKKAEEA